MRAQCKLLYNALQLNLNEFAVSLKILKYENHSANDCKFTLKKVSQDNRNVGSSQLFSNTLVSILQNPQVIYDLGPRFLI